MQRFRPDIVGLHRTQVFIASIGDLRHAIHTTVSGVGNQNGQ
ncbi:Uncharacterised protein [Vibrio cholerae]|nr:Uncharacterised protein [Vibrio cholerae]